MNPGNSQYGEALTYGALQDAASRDAQFTVVVNWNEVTQKFELGSVTGDSTLAAAAWSMIQAHVSEMIESLNQDTAWILDVTP